MANGLEILNWKPSDRPGSLKGFFSVAAAGTTINECRLIHPDGKNPFVSGPQRTWEKDGKKNYIQIVQFSEVFATRVMKAVEPFYKPGGGEADGFDGIPF